MEGVSFCNKDGKIRLCGGYPIPANIQSQAGWVLKQPDPIEDVPAHCREVGLDDL